MFGHLPVKLHVRGSLLSNRFCGPLLVRSTVVLVISLGCWLDFRLAFWFVFSCSWSLLDSFTVLCFFGCFSLSSAWCSSVCPAWLPACALGLTTPLWIFSWQFVICAAQWIFWPLALPTWRLCLRKGLKLIGCADWGVLYILLSPATTAVASVRLKKVILLYLNTLCSSCLGGWFLVWYCLVDSYSICPPWVNLCSWYSLGDLPCSWHL